MIEAKRAQSAPVCSQSLSPSPRKTGGQSYAVTNAKRALSVPVCSQNLIPFHID